RPLSRPDYAVAVVIVTTVPRRRRRAGRKWRTRNRARGVESRPLWSFPLSERDPLASLRDGRSPVPLGPAGVHEGRNQTPELYCCLEARGMEETLLRGHPSSSWFGDDPAFKEFLGRMRSGELTTDDMQWVYDKCLDKMTPQQKAQFKEAIHICPTWKQANRKSFEYLNYVLTAPIAIVRAAMLTNKASGKNCCANGSGMSIGAGETFEKAVVHFAEGRMANIPGLMLTAFTRVKEADDLAVGTESNSLTVNDITKIGATKAYKKKRISETARDSVSAVNAENHRSHYSIG
ncbi:hypothetical protein THAOC_25863, partial [Thalassiosira oceanica]